MEIGANSGDLMGEIQEISEENVSLKAMALAI
jgi:hypothetical protein